jgi:hypothetical protein
LSGGAKSRFAAPVSARDLEIFRRRLASVRDFLVLDDLTLIQAGQTGLLYGRNVYEDVPATILRLDESVSLLRIEPLNRAARRLVMRPPVRTGLDRSGADGALVSFLRAARDAIVSAQSGGNQIRAEKLFHPGGSTRRNGSRFRARQPKGG